MLNFVVAVPALNKELAMQVYEMRGVTFDTVGKIKKYQSLKEGETIAEYYIQNLRSGFWRSYFFSKSTDVYLDLSFKAPLDGVYCSRGFFGRDRILPKSLDDLRTPNVFNTAFTIELSQRHVLSGLNIFEPYFSRLKEHRHTIDEWMRVAHSNQNYSFNHFWDLLYEEEHRMNDLECPVFPHDGKPY